VPKPVHRDDKGKACLVVPILIPPKDNTGTPCFAEMLMVYIACDKVNVVPIGRSQRKCEYNTNDDDDIGDIDQ
jgi:hypothetical protein